MSWPLVLLDSVAERGSGHTPSQKRAEYWNGGIKWVSLADSSALDKRYIYETSKTISPLGLRHSSAILHPKETVILSRDAGVGRSAILGTEMAVSQHFIAWRCDVERLDGEYLYQWLQSQKREFERIATGSTVKTIGLPFFRKLRLPLPPLQIQKSIAGALAKWDYACENTEQLIAAKKALTGATILRLYHLSDREGEPRRLCDLLTESAEPGSCGRMARKLTVKLYGRGVVAKEERRQGSERTQYFVRRADQLIYSKLDFLNGAFGIIPPELDGYESTTDLPAFDVAPAVNPTWLLKYLTRPEYYSRQLGLARGQRKARRVHPSDFLASTLSVPPRALQNRIAEALTTVEDDLAKTTQLLEFLKVQKRGLMQKLLTGEWRLPVPPTASGEESG